MSWSDTPINGQQSVGANKTPINNAFTYIADTTKIDHFWDNVNSNLDGHHQFTQMPKFESGGLPADPTIATDIDGVYYVKDKTSAEAPDLQIAEPFYITNDGTNNQIMQLGFRAMIHFEMLDVSPFTITLKYAHNCSVVRTNTGSFTLSFTTDLPTDNYILFGSALGGSGNTCQVAMRGGTKATQMTQSQVLFGTYRVTSGALVDPLAVTVAVCGG